MADGAASAEARALGRQIKGPSYLSPVRNPFFDNNIGNVGRSTPRSDICWSVPALMLEVISCTAVMLNPAVAFVF